MHPRNHTRDMVVAGLMAALIAVSAIVAIPIGTVPVTLQVFFVVLAALLLPPWWASGAVLAYVLAGVVGLPVFAGGKGGLAVLLGPTGGYLIGFIVGTWFAAWVRCWFNERLRPVVADGLAAAIAISAIYVLGWVQLAWVTGMTGPEAFAAGVAPFVLPDLAKVVGAISVAGALRAAGIRPWEPALGD